MITKLLPNERLDDLQIKGYEIIQSPGRFCFGMDAVLLSAFARVKKNEKALDLGTGTGITSSIWIRREPFWRQNIRDCIIRDWRSRKRVQIWQGAVSVITGWKNGSTL